MKAMVDTPAKKRKKGLVSEEDVCTLLQRYTATTVLALLREVAQSADVKIDWNALVKKTSTGISNAREYQMLWRHLAYRQPLIDKIEDEAQPLDDDSDLEYELEPFPSVTTEIAMEAANCVKVLASGSSNESGQPNNSAVEGDVPNGHLSKDKNENSHPASLQNTNTTLPVSVQKQPQPAGASGEGFDANGSANYPFRRKRKPWSEEEDLELIAAVRKFGEGQWANIVKGEFKGDRTASQLSQRWAIIRKKQGNLNIGVACASGSQLSQAQLATRRAIDMALKDTLTTGCSTVGNSAAGTSNSTANANASNGDPAPVTNVKVPAQPPQPPSQVPPNTTSAQPQPAPMNSIPKPRPPPKKAPPKPIISPDSIQAAAVAAGARIASPSDISQLKKAQAKNAVRIIQGAGTSALPPNVHFLRSNLAPPPSSSMASAAPSSSGGGQQAAKGGGSSVKPPPPLPAASVPPIPKANSKPAPTSNAAAPSTSANVLQQVEGEATTSEVKVPGSNMKPMVGNQEGNAAAPSLSRNFPKASHEKGQMTSSPAAAASKDVEKPVLNNDVNGNQAGSVQGSCNPSVNGRCDVQPSSVVDRGVKKMDVSSEALAGADTSDPMVL